MMPNTLTYKDLKEILPHAYPFLLIDRVEEIKRGESLVAIKTITTGEWATQNEFDLPQHFPETLLMEAASQAALVLYHVSKIKSNEPRPRYILGKSKGEFFNQIRVGDTIHFHAFANKMSDWGGFSEVKIFTSSKLKAKTEVFYSVHRKR